MQRMIAVAAAGSLVEGRVFAGTGLRAAIGTDPNLRAKVIPWDLVLSGPEVKSLAVLCDLILPADAHSPSASAVGVPEFINEWVSAPYPQQEDDLKLVREGLRWIEREAAATFGKRFNELTEKEGIAICDAICSIARAKPERAAAALFFAKLRDLAAGGYYTTPEGSKDIGYIGNKPMAEFPGPPPEVLKHLGLE